MTRLVCLSIFVMLFTSCTTEKDICIVSGNLENTNQESHLYLLDDRGNIVIDSIKINDGTFKFELQLKHPKLFILSNDLSQKTARNHKQIWLQSGKVSLTANFLFINNAKLEGSNLNLQAKTFEKNNKNKLQNIKSSNLDLQYAKQSVKINLHQAELTNHKRNFKEFFKKQMRTNLNPYLAIHYLHLETFSPNRIHSKKEINTILSALPIFVQKSKQGIHIKKLIQSPDIKLGELAPDFTSTTPDGKKVSLSDFKGKYVLLDFWSSSCSPCRASHPKLKEYFNKYKSQDLEIISISGDIDKDRWTKAIAKDSMNWTNVSSLNGWNNEAFILYDIRYIPKKILVAPDGKIVSPIMTCSSSFFKKVDQIFNNKS